MSLEEVKPSVDEFTLPGGFIYMNEVFDKVMLREISGEEEDVLAAKNMTTTVKMDTVLSNCIEKLFREHPEGADPEEGKAPIEITEKGLMRKAVQGMTIGDRVMLILALRRISLGDEYLFQVSCPDQTECKNRFTANVFLSELPEKPMDDKMKRNFDLELPSGMTAKIRILEGRDESAVSRHKDLKQDILTTALSLRVSEINGEKADMTVLKKLGMKDRNFIRNSFDKHDGGVETTIDVVCPNCGREFTMDVDVGQQGFFFPSE